MKVIIAGGRDFNDYALLKKECDSLLKGWTDIEIISGDAPGADRMGEEYAREKGYRVRNYPAPWDETDGKPVYEVKTNKNGNKYWTKAGYHRNRIMAAYSDVLIAFWDGKSRGTKHMIETATSWLLLVHVIRY